MTPGARYRLPILLVTAVLLLNGVFLAIVFAPTHEDMGDIQRIFYFHVASAWIAYVAFAVTFGASVMYMRTEDLDWDDWAVSSAEIGVVFTTLTILTGPMWARVVWHQFWYWNDLKLTMTLVLWLVFIAYLVVRANVPSRRTKATLSGVFSVIGIICVPLSFAANRIWSTIHPTVLASEQGSIVTGEMVPALVVAVVAMTLLYATLLLQRVGVSRLRGRVEGLKHGTGD